MTLWDSGQRTENREQRTENRFTSPRSQTPSWKRGKISIEIIISAFPPSPRPAPRGVFGIRGNASRFAAPAGRERRAVGRGLCRPQTSALGRAAKNLVNGCGGSSSFLLRGHNCAGAAPASKQRAGSRFSLAIPSLRPWNSSIERRITLAKPSWLCDNSP
jgi:hypothetical protein